MICKDIETIKATATSGTVIEVTHRKICRSYADGKFEIVVDASDGDNVNPQNKDLDFYATQVVELIFSYGASDGRLVLQLVGIDGETARTIQVGFEFAGGRV